VSLLGQATRVRSSRVGTSYDGLQAIGTTYLRLPIDLQVGLDVRASQTDYTDQNHQTKVFGARLTASYVVGWGLQAQAAAGIAWYEDNTLPTERVEEPVRALARRTFGTWAVAIIAIVLGTGFIAEFLLLLLLLPFFVLARSVFGTPWIIEVTRQGEVVHAEQARGWGASRDHIHRLAAAISAGELPPGVLERIKKPSAAAGNALT